MKYLKQQTWFFLSYLFNLIYNIIPFFYFKNCVLRLFGNKIAKNSYIHTPIKFSHIRGLELKANCTINPNCYLDTRNGLIIGENVNNSHNSKIYTLGHEVDDPMLPGKGKSVIIEDDVFIFSNVLIMPGVRIGKGAVIYAGSVVTKIFYHTLLSVAIQLNSLE